MKRWRGDKDEEKFNYDMSHIKRKNCQKQSYKLHGFHI